ncbi:CPBP family intramembrane glutamic endopeptidase [Microlunatus sp. Y2014]|uniref:CPBP family intramembrane glutamic endopeptidase n=1 Tax=Microlunatus sp. Y2014 TaxID=3418488 RepID=UPI003DA79F94
MRYAITVTLFRPVLLVVAALITVGLLVVTGSNALAVTNPMVSTLYFTVVGGICLIVAHRVLHARGSSVRERIGFEPRRIPRDLLVGLGLFFALYLPFVIGLMAGGFLFLGAEPWNRFGEVFAPAATTDLVWSPTVALVAAVVAAVAFPLLNAPAEEIVYRGLAIDAFRDATTLTSARLRTVLAVVLPTIVFAVQHIMLAPTPSGMGVYACAFFCWGLAAALFAVRLKRLMPLVVAHVITNAAFSTIPLAMMIA